MIELLRRVAETRPQDLAVVTHDDRWTYERLTAEADALAHGLRAADVGRFAIVSNDVPTIVALLAASSLVGAEACVYAADISAADLERQAEAFGHQLVVTTRDDLDPARLDHIPLQPVTKHVIVELIDPILRESR